MDMKTYLDEEITRLHTRMTELEPNSEEYGDVEANYLKLVAQKLEIEKHEADRKDRVWRNINEGGKVLLTLSFAAAGTVLAYAFEAKGVIPANFIGKKFVEKMTKF